MKIVVSGPAAAYASNGDLVTDPSVLREVDGLLYDELVCSTVLDGPLSDLGIEGGSLRISFVAEVGRLKVLTEYRAPRKLTKKELESLVEQTRGQWSDGIGEGCFDDYEEKTGVSVSAFPAEFQHEHVVAEQVDDGSKARRISPLFKAAEAGDLKKLEKLLARGEDIEAKGRFEQTPLMRAVLHSRTDAVAFLLSRGANVNYKTSDEPQTSITTAAMIGDVRLLTVLLDAGANINDVDHRGATPVMWAANRGHIEALRLLVSRGADVNVQDRWEGHTALMYACAAKLDVVELLLKHGADPKIRSNDGQTASEFTLRQAISDRNDIYRLKRAEQCESVASFLRQYED